MATEQKEIDALRNAFKLARLARMAKRFEPDLIGMKIEILVGVEDLGIYKINRIMHEGTKIYIDTGNTNTAFQPMRLILELGEDEL